MDPLKPEDPRAIGAYRLLGRLGEGGMGQVYVARSARGRTVAVKTIQPALAREPEFRSRFAQEIATARRVGGRWTAPVLDADPEADAPWVATGYIAGPTLFRVVAQDYGPLPEPSVRFLAAGLVQALRDIHATGLVHRDLKPGNVMITIDGPRVIDFGIARALDVVTGGGLTRTGAVIGSPGFMSPEQVLGQRVTQAGDVFCLGSVLAYAATGRLPFAPGGSGAHAVMFHIVEKDPDLDGVPEGLRELIAECLRKAPEDRPTVADLLGRTAEDATPAGPWLPAEVLVQLGRQAIDLLDSENEHDENDERDAPAAHAARAAAVAAAVPTAPAGAPAELPPGPGGPERTPARGPGGSGGGPVSSSPTEMARQPTRPAPGAHAPVDTATASLRPPAGKAPRGSAVPARGVNGLSVVVCLLLAAALLFSLISVDKSVELYAQLGGWRGSGEWASGSQAVDDWEDTTRSLATTYNLLLLATAIVWAVWFWRLCQNAERLAPGRVRYGAGMGAACWFIPVGLLFLPKQMANDVWRTSGDPMPPRHALNAWWWCWLAHLLCLVPLFVCWDQWGTSDSLRDARMVTAFGAALHLPLMAAAITGIVFVRRITGLQRAALAAGTGTPPRASVVD